MTVERTIGAPVERCWLAFSTAEGLNAWFTSGAVIDFRIGGLYSADGGDRCEFLEIEDHRSIKMTWEHPKHTAGSVVMVEFEPSRGQTTVRLTHSGIANDDERRDLQAAWSGIMDDLRSVVEREV